MFYNVPNPEESLVIASEDFYRNAKVDVTQWVKKKQNLSYLPWNVARGLLRNYNPNLDVAFEADPNNGHPYFETARGVYLLAYLYDKTTGRRTVSMLYAVRGHNNRADVDASIDTINNSMQRAYSKVIAQETGLAWSLYSTLDESIDLDAADTVQEKVAAIKAASNGRVVNKSSAKDVAKVDTFLDF